MLCLHCHQSFCSRSTGTTETSQTSFELLVICFLLKIFVLSSWSWAVPEVRAFLKKTPVEDFVSPSANCTRVDTHISPDRCLSLSTPAEHRSRREATINAVPRSSGTLASVAKQSNKLLQSAITRMDKCSYSIRQAELSSQSIPHTTLPACILPGQERLDMHWLRPQN